MWDAAGNNRSGGNDRRWGFYVAGWSRLRENIEFVLREGKLMIFSTEYIEREVEL